jgi:hypothetical protein
MRADLAEAKDSMRASQPKPGSFEAAVGAPKPHIFPADKAAIDPAVAKVLDRVKSALSSGATDYDSLIDALRPLDSPNHVDLQAMSRATQEAILSMRAKIAVAKGQAATTVKPKPLSHAQARLADLSKQYHKHIPLGDVLDAAKASGLDPVQEDGTPWSGFLTGADGRATIALVDRKTGKPSKRALSVQWHRMPSGNHELNAYIS